jgi:phosphatidylinositol alpha 1,6-mannosyltransferase
MPHGVDAEIYSPVRRRQAASSFCTRSFCIGYVGRLTPEKNVRLLVEVEKNLIATGQRNFHFLVIGEGCEGDWLRKNLKSGVFPGILRGAALAEAFASMDVFAFPSRTDTFGLVLLEAMASGVPVIVSPETGARVGVRHGIMGFHAGDSRAFADSVLCLIGSDVARAEMSRAAREFAGSKNWCGVFERLYQTYDAGLEAIGLAMSRV